MHICRKRNCPKMSHQLTMNNIPIPNRESHKFLGMIVNNSLTWTDHIKKLKIDCYKNLNIFKFLSHTTWGADSRTLVRLYQALIKPRLEYGCEVYCSAKESQIKSLEPVQNHALRIATGAFRSSPINSLEVLSGVRPLRYTFDAKLLNYISRVYVNSTNPLKQILSVVIELKDHIN